MHFDQLDGDAEDDFEEDGLINWQRPSEDILGNVQDKSSQFSFGEEGHCRTLEGVCNGGHLNHSRSIIHVDFDCFYAQVETIRNPSLKTKPIAVYQKYVLVTSNYVARGLGVKKMSTKSEGLKACPELVLINGEDLTPYREFSTKMFDLIKEYCPIVERVGLDENFIDVTAKVDEVLTSGKQMIVKGHCYGFDKTDLTLDAILSDDISKQCNCGCIKRLAAASLIASNLRSALYSRLGLTASAGVAHNKVLAKLIGKTHKPNQQTTILPAFAVKFLSEKKVREIPGVGSRTSKLLAEMGVTTVSHLCSKSKESLIERFGVRLGTFLRNIAFGIDDTEVIQSENVLKSVSEEESYRKLTDYAEVKRQIEILVTKVLLRVDATKRVPKTIKLTLRKHFQGNNYSRESRQAPFNPRLLENKDQPEKVQKISSILLHLFEKMVDRSTGFDLAVINVGFTNFEEKSSSISKFFANSPPNAPPKADTQRESITVKESANTEGNKKKESTMLSERRTSKIRSLFGKASDNSEVTDVATDCSGMGDEDDLVVKRQRISVDADESKKSNVLDSVPSSSQSCPSCPDGINIDVFKELPKDIQEELLSSWRNENKQKRKEPNAPPKKKQKSNKNNEVKSKNILNYFSK